MVTMQAWSLARAAIAVTSIALGMGTTQAGAAILKVELSGFVTSVDFDRPGLPAPGVAVGDRFTATQVLRFYTDSKFAVPGGAQYYVGAYGQSFSSGSFSIPSHYFGQYASVTLTEIGGVREQSYFTYQGDPPEVEISITSRFSAPGLPLTPLSAFSYTSTSGVPLGTISATEIFRMFYDAPDNSATVTGAITSISISSGVPEPTTWAMMLIGFAGLAYAAGQRREPRQVAAL